MSGAKSRRKGHSFEREVATILKPLFPHARRKLEYHPEDAKGIDLQNTLPLAIQCKRGRNYAPIGKIEEPQIPVGSDKIPLLITKGDRTRPVAVMYLDDFLVWSRSFCGVSDTKVKSTRKK